MWACVINIASTVQKGDELVEPCLKLLQFQYQQYQILRIGQTQLVEHGLVFPDDETGGGVNGEAQLIAEE